MHWRAPGALGLTLLLIGIPVAVHEKVAAETVVRRAPGYSELDYPPPQPGSYKLPPIRAAADAPYVDSRGRRARLHELFQDHVTVLAFIYTQCDDVNGCPLATFVLSRIARRLQADAELHAKVRMVSFSFDLEHDTPAMLEKYARSFRPAGANWDFVTAPDVPTLATTLAAYQQTIKRSAGHAYAHILRVFLIDPHMQIRNIYSTSFLHADTLLADIHTLLLETRANPMTSVVDARAGNGHVDSMLGLPGHMNGPRPTARQAALGAQLFFDRRLSLNRTISCAMCHVPDQGFTVTELATAVGIEGRTVKRNAPTLLNIAFLDVLFHDARESRLEHQVWSPLLAHNEMGNPSIGYVIDNLNTWPEYQGLFAAAFGTGPTMETIGQALAAYQRTLIAGGSAFDRWYYSGDEKALSTEAQRGFEVFHGKGRCSACHTIGEQYALFTDQRLHNTGIGFQASMERTPRQRKVEVAPGTYVEYEISAIAEATAPPLNDLGRYEVTENPADRWKFRTPSLRNVTLTAPYMHNGALSTLTEVIDFYNHGGISNELLDPLIQPLNLSQQERAELLSFLESLTSPAVSALIARAREVERLSPRTRSAVTEPSGRQKSISGG